MDEPRAASARRGEPMPFKGIRIAQGRTQTWVAEQLGISKSRLCELENNYARTRITINELKMLASIYDTTIDDLVNGGSSHAPQN